MNGKARATGAVWKACCDILGTDHELDENASLVDLGIDSLGLAELVIQLEETYGEGSITIDDVIGNPVVKHIAAHLMPACSMGDEKVKSLGAAGAPVSDTALKVWAACCEIVGKEGAPFDADASLIDLGIDSLGMAELVIQLEEIFGEGSITVDDVRVRPWNPCRRTSRTSRAVYPSRTARF